ncbi:MAG: 1,4-dihydroxy-2-naphthoate octaprenyltransferase [Burkholderiaceae bacterium]|jgi:1,4-dihydroxy-2-naphthoate octaprenyltransferase|nr:1,4-dihydroxy-2-naphthoate octaprenyltransferase [Burkholderiaceae bacterium]
MPATAQTRNSRARAWWLAARAQTLSLSISPVLAGLALAWRQGAAPLWALAWATLLAALAIQIGANLLNDVGDFERGVDAPQRLGPPRAVAQGWLTARAVRLAGWLALGMAFVLGIGLVHAGGWPFAGLGLLALLCAWGYTAGPAPIACGPWGEMLVWLFFGLAAVCGSAALQAASPNPALCLTGHALGALAAAVLLVNNTRDAATDAQAGRRTLALLLGPAGSRAFYALLLAQPYVVWPWLSGGQDWAAWPCLTLPWAIWLVWRFARLPASRALNGLLAQTARLQLAWTALLALALLG